MTRQYFATELSELRAEIARLTAELEQAREDSRMWEEDAKNWRALKEAAEQQVAALVEAMETLLDSVTNSVSAEDEDDDEGRTVIFQSENSDFSYVEKSAVNKAYEILSAIPDRYKETP